MKTSDFALLQIANFLFKAQRGVGLNEVMQGTGVKPDRATAILANLVSGRLLVTDTSESEILYEVNLWRREELRQLVQALLEQFLPTKA